jgi:hypothetical protein
VPIQLLDDADEIQVKDSDLGVQDGDPETVYTLRVLSPQKYRSLTKMHTKKRPTGGRGMEEYLDTIAWSDAMWDWVLKAWNPGAVLWQGKPVAADDMVTFSDSSQGTAKYQLDGPRKEALLNFAGLNQVTEKPEDRERSFRSPE